MANEAKLSSGGFGGNFVEFTYPMFASNDSVDCLERDNCLPIGGYSVWSTFQDYNMPQDLRWTYNESKSPNDIIFATTSMDTTCLFHQNLCRGGNGNMAGLVGWMASIEALSAIKGHLNDPNSTLYQSDKQIVFAAFQGEAYDLVGSRKFVHDLQNGTFKVVIPSLYIHTLREEERCCHSLTESVTCCEMRKSKKNIWFRV